MRFSIVLEPLERIKISGLKIGPVSVIRKFIKPSTTNPNMKFVAAAPKGRLVVMSHPISSNKVNTSPLATFSHQTDDEIFPLPNCFSLI